MGRGDLSPISVIAVSQSLARHRREKEVVGATEWDGKLQRLREDTESQARASERTNADATKQMTEQAARFMEMTDGQRRDWTKLHKQKLPNPSQ